MLELAQSEFNSAREKWREAVVAGHAACQHKVWVERGTYKTAEWLSSHPAIRICRDCRAEIHDDRGYDEWLVHGKYSWRKPEGVELVLSAAQAGVDDVLQLRLPHDPRPHFSDFAAVLNWRQEK